jgi:hypothetical protein
MKFRSLLFLLAISFISSKPWAQYCTPTVTQGGIYFNAIQFNLPGHTQGVTGGTQYFSASQGYANNSAGSSGTIKRICYAGIPFNVYNPDTENGVSFNMRVFIDWNSDFDFDDAGETVVDYDNTLAYATSLGTGAGWTTPANAPATVRVRFAVREGGQKATPCGGYTGEIEDFTLTLATNTAPALNGAATPYINSLQQSQTDNAGFTTQQLFTSSVSGGNLTTDADNCSTGGFAIVGTSGSNGQWQYKIGSGIWTDFAAVSTSNALLLAVENSSPYTRIRFVPSGAGVSSFTYRAWDRSTGTNGQYANISSSGGTTAFGTTTATASVTTYSTAATASDIHIYMASASNSEYVFKVHSTLLNRSAGISKTLENVTTDDVYGYGTDIAIDNVNNKLVWVGGADGASLMRSNMDGSNAEMIASGFVYPTGVAVSNNKILIADLGMLYSCNPDGSGMTSISGGAGQASDISTPGDIEYANNKIYYSNTADYVSYSIKQANPDGTGTIEIYNTSTANITGLAITGGTLYWTENYNGVATVKSKLLSGGSATTLTTEGGYFSDLLVDEANSIVYIASVNYPDYDKPRLKSLPLAGGSTTRVLEMEDMAGGLAVNSAIMTLPVDFLGIKANWQGNAVKVQWEIGVEEGLQKYVVERSGDGRRFTDAGTVSATGKTVYTWLDQSPLAGKNHYRIRAVDIDGSAEYSNIVMVSKESGGAAVTVYPTLVSNGQVNLKLENVSAGNYSLNVIHASGQQVLTQKVVHSGGSSVLGINLPAAMPGGVYRLQIAGEGRNWVETIVVK